MDKTVRNLLLTETQKHMIVGSLLGDASIPIARYAKNNRVFFVHGCKQLEYLQWKRDLLYPFIHSSTPIKRKPMGFGKNGGGTFMYVTSTHPEFTGLRNLFYPHGKKLVPKSIEALLSPLGIATWYMDDGTLNSGRIPRLFTCAFSEEDVELLRRALLGFGVQSRIVRTSRAGLWIDVVNPEMFWRVACPHIHSSMMYKIPHSSC